MLKLNWEITFIIIFLPSMDKESLGSKSHGKIGLPYQKYRRIKADTRRSECRALFFWIWYRRHIRNLSNSWRWNKRSYEKKGNFTLEFVLSLNNELSYVKYV